MVVTPSNVNIGKGSTLRHKRENSLRLYATPPAIKQLMTLQGISSHRALAAKAGVHQNVAQRFTEGSMVDTSLEHAEKLANVLGVRVALLFVELRNTFLLEELAA